LTRFFSQRLIQQRHASPHTISSYRDTFRLLLQFAKMRLGKEPSRLAWEDLDAVLISGFLDHLQEQRGSGTRSRNLRLTAIRSLLQLCGVRVARAGRTHSACARHSVQALPPEARPVFVPTGS
jgi:site-specific recombinase XerC